MLVATAIDGDCSVGVFLRLLPGAARPMAADEVVDAGLGRGGEVHGDGVEHAARAALQQQDFVFGADAEYTPQGGDGSAVEV